MKHLSRRTFLHGAGTAIALPFLDAMVPSVARAAAKEAAPVRMAFLFVANGVIKDVWTPGNEGKDFSLPASLEPLKPFQNDLLVMTNLSQNQGKFNRAGDHARGTAAFLTGCRPEFSEGSDIKVGTSVDQIAALKVGHQTPLPSLELGTQGGKDAGTCDSGYSCAYSSNISWRSENQPMAKETNPRQVFERLFGNRVTGDEAKSQHERHNYKKSILDYVLEDAKSLQRELGHKDRQKMDEYLYSVRQVERRVTAQPLLAADGSLLNADSIPEEKPDDYAEHVRLMCDMMALAFQGDVTRIATFMFGLAGDNRGYQVVGVPEGHHDLSHHGGDENKIASLRKIDRYNVELFAYFIERLKSIPEGDRSLLDHCMVLYGSELGDGNRHSHNDLPILMAGSGGGAFVTGRHVRYEPDTPLNNLFLTMLDRMGAETEAMGDSTGLLTV